MAAGPQKLDHGAMQIPPTGSREDSTTPFLDFGDGKIECIVVESSRGWLIELPHKLP